MTPVPAEVARNIKSAVGVDGTLLMRTELSSGAYQSIYTLGSIMIWLKI